MVSMPSPIVLTGSVVTLRPLTLDDVDALLAAATAERSTYALTHVPGDRDATVRYVESTLAEQRRGVELPFVTTMTNDGRVVGSTRFLDLDDWRVRPAGASVQTPVVGEIGATWLTPSAQRTAVNTEAKLLMLGHAFDGWGVLRITFKTDARNARSRAAIERLGAQYEGIRRAHQPATDGGARNSAYYSIVRDEWPAVREALAAKLSA
jgi:RimJ/RimL family protein N-acetyltransferase